MEWQCGYGKVVVAAQFYFKCVKKGPFTSNVDSNQAARVNNILITLKICEIDKKKKNVNSETCTAPIEFDFLTF